MLWPHSASEYKVGDADFIRMRFQIKGPNGSGTVQMEMKKSKVGLERRSLVPMRAP
jgi:hypothetical protein